MCPSGYCYQYVVITITALCFDANIAALHADLSTLISGIEDMPMNQQRAALWPMNKQGRFLDHRLVLSSKKGSVKSTAVSAQAAKQAIADNP